MERAFAVHKDSKYYKSLEAHRDAKKKQHDFVFDFLDRHGIETHSYLLYGDGMYGATFTHETMDDIRLKIAPTTADLEKYGKWLNKEKEDGTRSFRKGCPLLNEFARECVEKEIVVGIYKPSLWDYFRSLAFYAHSTESYIRNDELRILIISDYLDKEETPEGFEEVQLSEFYRDYAQTIKDGEEDKQ